MSFGSFPEAGMGSAAPTSVLWGVRLVSSGRRMFHAVASERLAGIVAWSQELLPAT
jgi:hypothetical protein